MLLYHHKKNTTQSPKKSSKKSLQEVVPSNLRRKDTLNNASSSGLSNDFSKMNNDHTQINLLENKKKIVATSSGLSTKNNSLKFTIKSHGTPKLLIVTQNSSPLLNQKNVNATQVEEKIDLEIPIIDVQSLTFSEEVLGKGGFGTVKKVGKNSSYRERNGLSDDQSEISAA